MQRLAAMSFLVFVLFLCSAPLHSQPLCVREEGGRATVEQALQYLKQANSEAGRCSSTSLPACDRATSLLQRAQAELEKVVSASTRRNCWSCSAGVLKVAGSNDLFLPESLGQAANALAALEHLIQSKAPTRRSRVGRSGAFAARLDKALALAACSTPAPPPTRASYQGGGGATRSRPVSRRPDKSGSSGPLGRIQIRQATYGENCGAPTGNAQSHISRRCSGQADCGYRISSQSLGDPAPGCSKEYDVSWSCGESVFDLRVNKEAGGGERAVFLNCRGGQVMRLGRGITVLEASYGLNCRTDSGSTQAGNASLDAGQRCNRRTDCTYQVDAGRLGETSDSCAGTFQVQWMCSDGEVRRTSVRGEASGQSVRLSCPR